MSGLIARPVARVRRAVDCARSAAQVRVENMRNSVSSGVLRGQRAVQGAAGTAVDAATVRVTACVTAARRGGGAVRRRYEETRAVRAVVTRRACHTALIIAALAGAVVAGFILRDVYDGNYDAAGRKADAVEAFVRRCSDATFHAAAVALRGMLRFLWLLVRFSWVCGELAARCALSVSQALLSQLWSGGAAAAASGCEAAGVAGVYAAESTVTVARVVYGGTRAAAEYSFAGSKTFLAGAGSAASFAWEHGSYAACVGFRSSVLVAGTVFEYCVAGSHTAVTYVVSIANVTVRCCMQNSRVVFAHVHRFASASADHVGYASKVIGNYTVNGSIYAYEHGTVAAREMLSGAYTGALHYGQLVGEQSALVAGYSWNATRVGLRCLLTGSYSGGVLLADGCTVMAEGMRGGAAVMADWAVAAAGCLSRVSVTVAESASVGGGKAYDVACVAGGWSARSLYSVAAVVYDVALVVSSSLWSVGAAVVTVVCHVVGDVIYGRTGGVVHAVGGWIAAAVGCVAAWCCHLVASVAYCLHVVLNRHFVRYIFVGGRVIGGWVCDAGVGAMCFVDACVRRSAAAVVSVVSLLAALTVSFDSLLRLLFATLVAAVTLLFRSVIWLLAQVALVYAAMLQQYDVYRDVLFVTFIVIIIVYCTGLVRDRRPSSGDGSDDEIDGDAKTDDVEDDAATGLQPDSQPPPAYNAKSPLPGYDDANGTNLEASDGSEIGSDSDIDSGSDFELDQEVPDVMDSSSSEAELDFFHST